MNLDDIARSTDEQFQEEIILNLKMAKDSVGKDDRMFDGERFTRTIFVYSNHISRIISNALAAAKEVMDYSVYYQPNNYDYEETNFFPYEFQKQQFTDFCNYVDKYKAISLHNLNINLYNYSKNLQKEVYADYPTDIQMILIVENFNFWDLNSQYFLSKLSQNPNIVVIGQIRTDIDFIANHLDREACTFAAHYQFEE